MRRKVVLVFCMAFLAVLAGCQKSSASHGVDSRVDLSRHALLEGYSAEREVTAEEAALFVRVIEEYESQRDEHSTYEPLMVAVKAEEEGTHYCFTAKMTTGSPAGDATTVNVFIFHPLDGAPEMEKMVVPSLDVA